MKMNKESIRPEWRKSGKAFLVNPVVLQKAINTNMEKALKNERNQSALTIINMLRTGNKSYQRIAKILNENGYKTSQGSEFQATQVIRLYNRNALS